MHPPPLSAYLGPDADIDGKSLGFAYNGPKKISLELDEKKTEYKGLVILRTVGQRQPNGHAPYIYSLMTWKRNGKKSLTIRGASINLPSHIPFERYEWEAMLYLVPDDFELNMTPAGRIPASNLILSYQPSALEVHRAWSIRRSSVPSPSRYPMLRLGCLWQSVRMLRVRASS